ncbi:MAG: hypothetical protein E7514_01485 [Ruminococcaceae bacterium]|nr:hypothetical protein [Oscillospiraceae bacterium]
MDNKTEQTKKDNVLKFNSGRKYAAVIYALIALLFISFFIYQIYKINHKPFKTEVTLEKTVYTSAVTDAFIIRDEYPIPASVSGTLVPLVEDGKRVASGDNVAVVFSSDDAAKNYNEIKELEKNIEYYSSLQNKVGVQTADITPLDERIYSACEDYIRTVNTGRAESYASCEATLREYINSRQLSTGTVIDPSVKLEELNTRLEQLKAQNMGYNTITAPHPGYYISVNDGYENRVNYAGLSELDTSQIMDIVSNQGEKSDVSGYMGKLVDGFKWYILCVIDYNDAVKLREGSTVEVSFTMTSAKPLEATVYKICDTVDSKAAVILSSNLMNTEYARLRSEQVRITFDRHTGYQVNNSAVREVDSQKGVYVKSGNIIQFKKINIDYSDNEISICTLPKDAKASEYIALYDEVITEGTDLYDGKVIS